MEPFIGVFFDDVYADRKRAPSPYFLLYCAGSPTKAAPFSLMKTSGLIDTMSMICILAAVNTKASEEWNNSEWKCRRKQKLIAKCP
jgi:hypothetical protein